MVNVQKNEAKREREGMGGELVGPSPLATHENLELQYVFENITNDRGTTRYDQRVDAEWHSGFTAIWCTDLHMSLLSFWSPLHEWSSLCLKDDAFPNTCFGLSSC